MSHLANDRVSRFDDALIEVLRHKDLDVLRLSQPRYISRKHQLSVLKALCNFMAFRNPNGGKTYATSAVSNVELGMWLNLEELEMGESALKGRLEWWKHYGVKKGRILNYNAHFAGFGG